MTESCIELQCSACGNRFSVELGRMRVNLGHVCPRCGSECPISSDQALQAHRALERIENETKPHTIASLPAELMALRALDEAAADQWPPEPDWPTAADPL